MTAPSYTAGTVVTKGHYNWYATGSQDGTLSSGQPSVGLLWGVGFGPYGYGQDTAYIDPVETGDVINIQQWNNLDAILSNIRDHQLGPNTYPGMSMLDTGQIISPRALYAPNILAAYDNNGKVYETRDIASTTAQYQGLWGYGQQRILKLKHTVTFPTADAARYFFNAGGKLKLSFTNTSTVVTPRSTYWSEMCQSAGSIQIGWKNTIKQDALAGDFYGARDIVLDNNNGGYWAHQGVGAATIQHYRQNYTAYMWDSYTYDHRYGYGDYYGRNPNAIDYLTVDMSVRDGDELNGNIGRTIEITTTFVNGTSVPPMGDYNDEMNSTVRAILTVGEPPVAPNGFLQTNTWHGYTVTPGYVVSAS